MLRRQFLLGLLTLLAAARGARADGVPKMMKDAYVPPPARREYPSPSGKFVLTLSSADGWKTFHATAELAAIDGAERRMLWHQTLPHEKGPRRVLVLDSGAVVLIDEWINIPSRHALMLIGPEGRILAHYSLDALIATLGVSRRAISANSTLGIWLGAMPVASADGSTLEFRAGGRRLLLELANGRLFAED